MIVYFNGQFMPKEEVKISPDDRGFLLGDGVYEVIRSYSGRLFKVEEHIRRLARSLRELRIEGVDTEALKGIAEELIEYNELERGDAKLYVQVTRGVAPRRHSFPDGETSPTVYATASAFQPPRGKWEHGVKVILVPDIRWARCDIKSVALLPNILANQQAKERGAEEAIFVRNGAITEGSHTSFCAVFDGELTTHPKSNYILAGIMRETVLDLCDELDIPVKEFPIFERDLKEADEVMILGTTSEIMPVVQVDDWQVGDGKPGPIAVRLQRAYRELAY
mgnify:CR=1 FL=1